MSGTTPPPECEATLPTASPTPEDKTLSPDVSTSPSESSTSASTDDGPFLPDLPTPSGLLVSESQPPSIIECDDEKNESLTPSDRHRETFRRRARWVLEDPDGWAMLRTKFKTGKLSPQEFAALRDAGYHFDVEVKPAPPVVMLQIQQVFADGETATKRVTVTTAEPKK
jgi:hypothetical protein